METAAFIALLKAQSEQVAKALILLAISLPRWHHLPLKSGCSYNVSAEVTLYDF